jgi:hypothetical protein
MDIYMRIPMQVFTISCDLQHFKMSLEIQADKLVILVFSQNLQKSDSKALMLRGDGRGAFLRCLKSPDAYILQAIAFCELLLRSNCYWVEDHI